MQFNLPILVAVWRFQDLIQIIPAPLFKRTALTMHTQLCMRKKSPVRNEIHGLPVRKAAVGSCVDDVAHAADDGIINGREVRQTLPQLPSHEVVWQAGSGK